MMNRRTKDHSSKQFDSFQSQVDPMQTLDRMGNGQLSMCFRQLCRADKQIIWLRHYRKRNS